MSPDSENVQFGFLDPERIGERGALSNWCVWFWQRMVTPHMAHLAIALAERGVEVVYVAEEVMAPERQALGWTAPDLKGVRFACVASEADVVALVNTAPAESVHICQGVRSNGLIRKAQRLLARRKLRQWVIMETVADEGWRGVLRRLEYRRLFAMQRSLIGGVLAIGQNTPEWLIKRGVPPYKVFPFAYFLQDAESCTYAAREPAGQRVGFIFVGRFDENKRLSALIEALATFDLDRFELSVVGAGPLESELRSLAEHSLPGHVNWIGRLPQNEVSTAISQADCLVLPSRRDGWGAVVSEALMVGTPVICSDGCGAAGAALASGSGLVFRRDQIHELISCVDEVLARGPLSSEHRLSLATWGASLGARAGAKYLAEIINHMYCKGERPPVPWLQLVPTTGALSISSAGVKS